jgi:beta-phosphoglucomutase-like phosphatase (HAD superfamily)
MDYGETSMLIAKRRSRARGPSVVLPRRRGQGRPPPRVPAVPPTPPVDLDTLAAHWHRALDASERALAAARGTLSPGYVSERRAELARERQRTAELLVSLARARSVRPEPWLAPGRIDVRELGLPATTRACLFDLDGVLTDSGLLHAWAWGEVLDGLLLGLAQETGWQFVPFDRREDYRVYIEGRPRLEGIHGFLDSRGIRLPEGRPGDSVHARSAWGLANRKGDAVERGLQRRGVTALPGARRYLEAAGQAGIDRSVISASASTAQMLELAALATLVETYFDADAIRADGLRAPPAPDVCLAACDRLGVTPDRVVSFTHSAAGVAAGLAAGLTVVGVGTGIDEELLRGFGAERVVPSLGSLLDSRLGGGAV